MRSWSKSNGRGEKYVHVEAYVVVVGEHHGSGHTDNAGSCSDAAFLAGQFQDLIREEHGAKVLSQVIATVEGADDDANLKKVRRRDSDALSAWREIPENPALLHVLTEPDDRGMDHYEFRGPIGVWHRGLFYEVWQQSVRLSDRSGTVVFELPSAGNDYHLGNNLRVGDVVRKGDVVAFAVDNYFLRDVPAAMALLGRRSWLQVGPDGIQGRYRER